MNTVVTTLHGADWHLLFNGGAMFALQEAFGDGDLAGLVFEDSPKGLDALYTAFCVTAEQGELLRRHEGHDPRPLPQPEHIRLATMPTDLPSLRAAVMKAILHGYGREIEEDETDLGLMELQKKTKAP